MGAGKRQVLGDVRDLGGGGWEERDTKMHKAKAPVVQKVKVSSGDG